MKSRAAALLVVISIAALSGGVIAVGQEQASIEKGRKLFNDPGLGTNGKTCSTCHPNGKGLGQAGTRANLADIINGCITIPLKGAALDPRSIEMQSLVLYVKSFGSAQLQTK